MGWDVKIPSPAAPSLGVDEQKKNRARLQALAYAETQKKIRAGTGRQATFLTTKPGGSLPGNPYDLGGGGGG